MKITELSNKSVFSKNNNNKPAFSRYNNNKSASRKNNGNNEVGFDDDSIEYTKKLKKLKDQKLAKSQKLSKSKKSKSNKLLKSKNSPNFDAIEARPSFLILDAKTTFNCLQLAFTKALILGHFDLEYYI